MKSRRRRWAKARREMRRLLWVESTPAASGTRVVSHANTHRLIELGIHFDMEDGQEYPVRPPKMGRLGTCPTGVCAVKP